MTTQPLVPYLKVPPEGEPYLEGLECTACEAIFIDDRRHCARCSARDGLKPRRLASTGSLHAFSVVHRSFPEIEVPYVSAVVDLDGGGTVKANLVGVDPDPAAIEPGLRVELTCRVAPERDEQGNAYWVFGFQPQGSR